MVKIELTEEQLIDITNQEHKRLGIPTIEEMAYMSLKTQLEMEAFKELFKAAKKKNVKPNRN